jgi:hypothetical protein
VRFGCRVQPSGLRPHSAFSAFEFSHSLVNITQWLTARAAILRRTAGYTGPGNPARIGGPKPNDFPVLNPARLPRMLIGRGWNSRSMSRRLHDQVMVPRPKKETSRWSKITGQCRSEVRRFVERLWVRWIAFRFFFSFEFSYH